MPVIREIALSLKAGTYCGDRDWPEELKSGLRSDL